MPSSQIREILLEEVWKAINDHSTAKPPPAQSPILENAAKRLNVGWDEGRQREILTEWQELFRAGLLAWGLNLNNPNPPFFHVTARGRGTLEKLSRDPNNPEGYLRYITSIAEIPPIARSYLLEALQCYRTDLHKSAAVMVGTAAEAMILDLRDRIVYELKPRSEPVPKDLSDWQIKRVTDALKDFVEKRKSTLSKEDYGHFEAYWSGLAQQIRVVRNEAGHPNSVEPVTVDAVHASLLIFPELVRVVSKLATWVGRGFTP